MSFIKDIKENKKELSELRKEVSELKAFIMGDTSKRAQKADELEEYLSHVGLKIKNITYPIGPDGRTDICISYEAPQVILRFNDNDEPIENPVFKAINMLNLLSNEDFVALSKAISQRRGINKR